MSGLPYRAPLRDMRFVIEEVLDAPAAWRETPVFAELDAGTAAQVLEQAAAFASEVLAPLNAGGDLQGCRWDDGRVTTPSGFREAYRTFVDGGWPALACDPAWGGQGLPQLLNVALYEMLHAANHAWAMYPGLAHGAYECLKAHGSVELQQRYLRHVVSGEWLATMCLTEAHAGSDLGLLRTKAVPRPDGSVQVSGSKIFISGGEHDLTDNIVHLVLCRLPDAPPGTRGLSLVLVPKVLPDGTPNRVRCDGIEKKMGIKGSATCMMRFEGATGWLVGEPHRGLAAMFVMMNAARLQVGLQGLGHLEIATQNALRYAHERHQMRAPQRSAPDAEADPIAAHPAMRRTLWTLAAWTEGLRVLGYWAAQLLDESEHHPDPVRRERAARLLPVLTPVVKALFTRLGFEGSSLALQVWGGHGYVHETGIEQHVRDARIAMIYEGTNEIQAIDLVVRKLLPDGAGAVQAVAGIVEEELAVSLPQPALATHARAVRQALDGWCDATRRLADDAGSDAELPWRVAEDLLQATGLLLLGWAWLRSARVAHGRQEAWYERKRRCTGFGLDWLLPDIHPALARVQTRGVALPPLPQP
ncbi:acyl-CoA dehydrogenase family protein [Caldimonas thermodepolymerans]|uniref:acyl-CoA dehydrogenase family protein n=1 Tax=Caldimonas thermodepolymerans TaxID=215580 RepID=UPI00248FB61E|nr:acyl-CoA dehydrogenase family protein [Caldimonas thermodepolymerans]